jgi:hypothetical protein
MFKIMVYSTDMYNILSSVKDLRLISILGLSILRNEQRLWT